MNQPPGHQGGSVTVPTGLSYFPGCQSAPFPGRGPVSPEGPRRLGPKGQWLGKQGRRAEEAGLGLLGVERRAARPLFLPPLPLGIQVPPTHYTPGQCNLRRLGPSLPAFLAHISPPCSSPLGAPLGLHPGTVEVKALFISRIPVIPKFGCSFPGFLGYPELPQPPAHRHPRVSPACSCTWYSPCRPLSCPGGLAAAPLSKQAGRGTGLLATQQSGRQGTQGCCLCCPNSAGRTQPGMRTSGCWVLDQGQAPPLPLAQPWDSGALGSRPGDFEALYLGRASSLSLSLGVEEEGVLERRTPPQSCLGEPSGCGELPAGDGGAGEPRECPLGGLGAQAAPLD